MVLETLLPDAQNFQRSINGAINNKTPGFKPGILNSAINTKPPGSKPEVLNGDINTKIRVQTLQCSIRVINTPWPQAIINFSSGGERLRERTAVNSLSNPSHHHGHILICLTLLFSRIMIRTKTRNKELISNLVGAVNTRCSWFET
jgi:hypothetical protein